MELCNTMCSACALQVFDDGLRRFVCQRRFFNQKVAIFAQNSAAKGGAPHGLNVRFLSPDATMHGRSVIPSPRPMGEARQRVVVTGRSHQIACTGPRAGKRNKPCLGDCRTLAVQPAITMARKQVMRCIDQQCQICPQRLRCPFCNDLTI